MVRRSRRPEKLFMAWDILRRKADTVPGIGTKRVEYPLKVLVSSGIAAPGIILTRLEKAKYIKKHTNGTRELVWVEILTTKDLGEDILGNKPLLSNPSGEHRVAMRKISEPVKKAAAETDGVKEDISDDVIVVCDHENLRRTLEDEGAELDFGKLIERARQYGNVLRSTAFMPIYTSSDTQTELRIGGFRIEVCPPRKLKGPDTCDQAIEEVVRFCLSHTNIDTFVLVSGDGDFIDIVGEIKNRGRKCILFYCNYTDTSKLLLSKMGDDAFNIASIARPKAKVAKVAEYASSTEPKHEERVVSEPVVGLNSSKKNGEEDKYDKLIESLRDGAATLEKTGVHWSFLKAIVACLNDMGLVSGDSRYRKSFPELKTAVWQEVFREFNRLGVTKDGDCHQALSALRKLSVIRTVEQNKVPHTYYVFDGNHPSVAAILSP